MLDETISDEDRTRDSGTSSSSETSFCACPTANQDSSKENCGFAANIIYIRNKIVHKCKQDCIITIPNKQRRLLFFLICTLESSRHRERRISRSHHRQLLSCPFLTSSHQDTLALEFCIPDNWRVVNQQVASNTAPSVTIVTMILSPLLPRTVPVQHGLQLYHIPGHGDRFRGWRANFFHVSLHLVEYELETLPATGPSCGV